MYRLRVLVTHKKRIIDIIVYTVLHYRYEDFGEVEKNHSKQIETRVSILARCFRATDDDDSVWRELCDRGDTS